MFLFLNHACLEQQGENIGRGKVNKSGYIRKDTKNKQGYSVSADKLQPDHPGLVTQLSGKCTCTRIWDAKVMMNHFSDITYLNLMSSTIQSVLSTVHIFF